MLFFLFSVEDGLAHQANYPEFKDYGDLGGDFTLQSTLGKKIQLSEYKDSLVLVYFGFTSCPDICPITLSVAAKAISKLKNSQQKKIQLLFISVDTKDSLKKISQYLKQFDKNFIGLKGNEQELREVIFLYGGFFAQSEPEKAKPEKAEPEKAEPEKAKPENNSSSRKINHTGYLYLLDNQQKIRALYRSDSTVSQLHSGLKKLLKEIY